MALISWRANPAVSAPSDPAPREGAATLTGLSVPEAALVVGIVLVWASLYPVGKLMFTEITASQLTFARAALASAVLLAACADNDAVYCPEHRVRADAGLLWASYAGSETTQEAHISRSAVQEPPGPRSWLQRLGQTFYGLLWPRTVGWTPRRW